MVDTFSVATAAQTYLLETAPVVALRLDSENRIIEANRQARRLLGDQAIGCLLADRAVGFFGSIDGVQRLTLSTISETPETLYFRFFPLPDGTLALGSFDFQEQQKLARQLHQANAEVRSLNDLASKQAEETKEHNETLRQQSLASLNLMEDAVVARERAEQVSKALRASEARGRAIFKSAPDAAFLVYPEGRCVEINAITLPRYGYSREEFLTMTPDNLAVPELAVEFNVHLAQGRHRVTRFESRHRRKDGSEFPVDVTASPLVLDGIVCVLCVAKDSTERKKAEEALSRSELRYSSILEAAPDPIVVVDQPSHIILVNAAAERVFGYQRAELLGQSVDLIMPPRLWASDERQPASLTSPPQGSRALGTEGYAVRKDGVEIPIEVRLGPATRAGEAGLQVMLAIRDLSGIKRAEAKFQKLLGAAPDAIVVANGEGEIVLVNTRAERMFGRPREALLGRNIDLLFPERFQHEHERQRAAYFANLQTPGIVTAAELFGLHSGGAEFPIEVSLSPLETDEGMLVFSAIRDVTERKNAEQRSRQLEILAAEAEAANKAKSMFLSTMSHEIRTPMNAILGYSQLMLRDPNLGADAKANLKIINRSGEHLLNMVSDTLDLAKIEAGRMQLSPKTFGLRSLLCDLEAMFRLRAEAKAVQFAVLVSGVPLEYLIADEGKIRQVLINLLGNAVKFTEHGRIGLHVDLNSRADDRLWLSAHVEDTGIGMTVEEQNSLFQPFIQGQAAHAIRQGGTGLGLAISQKVAHLMGGDITASGRPGSGSIFRFEVPVARAADWDLNEQHMGTGRVLGIQPGLAAPRILIADDVPDNREWLSRLLTSLGFSVRMVDNGQTAICAWEEWSPQLILMDVHMPVMDGLEATRRIRSYPGGKDTVIIALTADVMENQRRVVLENDLNDFIAKPCSEGELLEKISTYLGLVYVYGDPADVDGMKTASLVTPAAPGREQLRALPDDLIRELHHATLCGDKALLDKLIITIKDRGEAQSARVLQELADTYQYDRLIQLLENACPR